MNVYDFIIKAQDGSETALADFRGKALLIVNPNYKSPLEEDDDE